MDRSFYIDLARRGVRFPIGADLVLHEKPDYEKIAADGGRLGQVVEETAKRFRTPLAIPLMDLMVEKDFLLTQLEVPAADRPTYHFHALPEPAARLALPARLATAPLPTRLQANVDAVRYIAQKTDLVPVGMVIGPFSLMTKLVSDPITPVYLAGSGTTAQEDPEVELCEWALDTAMRVIERSVDEQIKAGAKVMVMAEPAANKVYFSPKQIEEEGADIYERYSIARVRAIRDRLTRAGVDLFFHDCGELTEGMLKAIAALEPVVLSLGCSRLLWEDAAHVSKNTVLYGNLPTKRFIQESPTAAEIKVMAKDLLDRMKATGHPFILGSECDVLSVPGYEQRLREKVEAFLSA